MTGTPDPGSLLIGRLGGGRGGCGGDLFGSLMGALAGEAAGPGGPGGHGGVLPSVLATLLQGDLGPQAHSWVGPGANEPVTGEQVAGALPYDVLRKVAREHGLGLRETADRLARILPQAVDRLTPDGRIPQAAPPADLMPLRQDAVR
ncbi:YidB family protein [Streptomyces sp. MST-110588]|uniref:YidB family protein n=1 Tax=Streptomyces sp. MST-110588 TaxID=2833628 RepID=UPI001F5D6CC6|nr:YidB family protein [Streptomyces sp. MST-110588]UNO42854.1 DUF937 domain-containing protein [Streptomyces sp. MST-110588]